MSNYTHFEYKAGLSQVGQYQLSGIPYVSGAIPVPNSNNGPISVSFPQVTRFVTITNTVTSSASAILRVGFSALGVTGSGNGPGGSGTNNYFTLLPSASYTADVRVTKIFLMGENVPTSASIVAGLTGISTGSLQNNWSGSIGVG